MRQPAQSSAIGGRKTTPNRLENDFQALLRGAPDLYLVLDREHVIVEASDRYLAATMTRREDLIGRNIFDAFPDNPGDDGRGAWETMRLSLDRVARTLEPDTMAVQKYDVRDQNDPESEAQIRYWSPVNTPVLRDGELWMVIHKVEDVTEFVLERQRSEREGARAEELRGRVENMQAEILRRGAELQETNYKLRAAADAKNEFLSRMSHELRTPLTAVIGYAELLKLELEPGSQNVEDVDAIFKAGQHLAQLVDEVLDLSRIEEGRIDVAREAVPVSAVINEAVELGRPMAERRDIALETRDLEASLYASADRQRLKQVVINLVSNGVKYIPSGGTVELRATRGDEGRVLITVSDNGPGIARENLDRLFTPFDRLGAEASGIEGTGLGLALSKRLIEAMSGTITVDSEVGHGTTFTIELPLAETVGDLPDAAEAADFALRSYPGRRTVLYIDDTAENVQLIDSMLRRRPSVELVPAMLGRLGLDLARENSPDLILLDLHLPDLEGPEILRALKADPSTREIPVVVLSADATDQQREKLFALGADAYKTKPIGIGELLAVADEYLAGGN